MNFSLWPTERRRLLARVTSDCGFEISNIFFSTETFKPPICLQNDEVLTTNALLGSGLCFPSYVETTNVSREVPLWQAPDL